MPRLGHDDRELWLFCGDLCGSFAALTCTQLLHQSLNSCVTSRVAFSESFKTPLGRFLHRYTSLTELVCSPPRSLLHNTKVGADRCTIDVSTDCVIVSLEPHASEPSELCVLSISRVPSIPSVPSWTCLSLSSLLTASILRSLSTTLLLNQNTSRLRAEPHLFDTCECSREDGQFYPLRHFTSQRMIHHSQAIL